METSLKKLKDSKVSLKVTFSPEEMTQFINTAYLEVAPTVKVAGFRPGKVPRKIVEAQVGISRILGEAIDLAMNEGYKKAILEHKLMPISSPSVKVEKYPSYGTTAEEIKDELEFEIELEVFPEYEIGDYSKITIEKPRVEKPKKEDIEKIIDNLQKQKASFIEVEREAKKGDFAELTYEGSLKGVKIDSMSSKNHPLVLGENTLIPGFEDEVIGMKKGEKKTFKIKFPKDYHAKEYANKDAEFNVELVNLKEVKLPEVDDKFAEDFGQESVSKLKAEIEKSLALELEEKARGELESKVLDKVLPLISVEIPESLVENEISRMIQGQKDQLASMKMNFDSYLKSLKKTEDDLKKEMRKPAERNIKIGLLLGRIAEEQKLDKEDKDAGKKAIDYLIKKIVK